MIKLYPKLETYYLRCHDVSFFFSIISENIAIVVFYILFIYLESTTAGPDGHLSKVCIKMRLYGRFSFQIFLGVIPQSSGPPRIKNSH